MRITCRSCHNDPALGIGHAGRPLAKGTTDAGRWQTATADRGAELCSRDEIRSSDWCFGACTRGTQYGSMSIDHF